MMRILFITSNRLGDAVITTAALDALLRRYPTALFTIVSGPVAAGLFEAVPRCERLIMMEKQRWDRHWLDLWRDCIGTRWFMVVDLRGSLLGFALRTRRRLVVRGGRRPGLRIAQLGRALGYNRPLMPRVWTTIAQQDRARFILPDRDAHSWLAIAPTANWDIKIWPAENFVTLARHFRARGFTPVVIYGPGEEEWRRARPVVTALQSEGGGVGCVDLGGQNTLGEVAALLGRCHAFVGNDSGLMHLAAAVGVPTLGLFGPSRASEYAPTGPVADFIAAPGFEGHGVMADLRTGDVIDALERILTERPSRRGGVSVAA